MHRGGRGGGHRRHHRGPSVRISTGGRHHRGGRRGGGGLFRGLLGLLFFTSILNMAKTNPDRARSSCSKVKTLGIVLTLLGLGALVGGIFGMMMQVNSSVLFFMIPIGAIVLSLGISMISEASYAYYQCGADNGSNDYNDSSNYNNSSNNSQPINNEVTCVYCHGVNNKNDSRCSSCGATL